MQRFPYVFLLLCDENVKCSYLFHQLARQIQFKYSTIVKIKRHGRIDAPFPAKVLSDDTIMGIKLQFFVNFLTNVFANLRRFLSTKPIHHNNFIKIPTEIKIENNPRK